MKNSISINSITNLLLPFLLSTNTFNTFGQVSNHTCGAGNVHNPAITYGQVADLFDGASGKQSHPGLAAPPGKLGHTHHQVDVCGVAQPDRKSEVVADEGRDAPAQVLKDQARPAACVVFMLARQGEQVGLVVMQQAAIGKSAEAAVENVLAISDDEAAQDQGLQALSLPLHPLHGGPVHVLCQTVAVHAESGGEHLAEHDQIGRAGDCIQMSVQVLSGSLRILSSDGSLHKRKSEVLHNHQTNKMPSGFATGPFSNNKCRGSLGFQNIHFLRNF